MRHSSVLIALCLVGCFSAKDNALFTTPDVSGGAGSSSAGTAGSAVTQAGTGSGGGVSEAGTVSTAGSSSSSGASAGTEMGGTSGTGPAVMAGSAGQAAASSIESCDMLDGAVVNDANSHCYRLEQGELTFAAARDACSAVGGHLVTITDDAENEFVKQFHDGDHWLGATDGRDNSTPGVGTYTWVTGEPWDYEDWEGGQPNAHAIDCPNESGGAHCHEHCAYQKGGGGWLDRACWDKVPIVCEWDLSPGVGAGGQGTGP